MRPQARAERFTRYGSRRWQLVGPAGSGPLPVRKEAPDHGPYLAYFFRTRREAEELARASGYEVIR